MPLSQQNMVGMRDPAKNMHLNAYFSSPNSAILQLDAFGETFKRVFASIFSRMYLSLDSVSQLYFNRQDYYRIKKYTNHGIKL